MSILKNSKNILIVNYGNIGDLAVALIVNQNIHHFYPGKKIYSIVSQRNHELLKFDPSINSYFVWDERNGLLTENIAFLKNNDISHILFLRGLGNKKVYNEIYSCLKKNLQNIEFIGMIKDENESFGFNQYFVDKKHGNIFEQLIRFIKYLSEKDIVLFPQLTTPECQDVSNEINKKFTNTSLPLIYINLSAGRKCKWYDYVRRNLSTEKYIYIIEHLIEKYKTNVIVTVAPDDLNKGYFINNIFKKKNNFLFYETRKITEVIDIIKLSNFIITPETSIIHLASLFNKPIIGLYTSQEKVKYWAPFSEKYVCLLPKVEGLVNTIDIRQLFTNIDYLLNTVDKLQRG